MHGFRCCIGGDIKVFRVPAEQQVANGAAHQVGLAATTRRRAMTLSAPSLMFLRDILC